MDILAILKGFVTAITAAFLALTGVGGTVAPSQIDDIASTTDQIVQEATIQAPTTTKKDVSNAYDLGKAVGKLQAQSEKIKSQAPNTMNTQNEATGTKTAEALDRAAESHTSTPAPVADPVPVVAPEPVSKAHIEIISPIAGKGLGRTYKAASEVVNESNYVDIAAIVYGDNGDPLSDTLVIVTCTDSTQEKTLRGTGDVANIYVNGQKVQVPVYSFHYEFKTAGKHEIVFTAVGVFKIAEVQVAE